MTNNINNRPTRRRLRSRNHRPQNVRRRRGGTLQRLEQPRNLALYQDYVDMARRDIDGVISLAMAELRRLGKPIIFVFILIFSHLITRIKN